MANMRGLGRGLDALLGGDTVSGGDTLRTMQIGQLQPGKYQPRTQMDQESLRQLADSIRAQGIMQPILVRPVAFEKFEIIAGERRWRAAQLAGLSEVPALVREIADEAALAMSLIENIQREDLNPLEEATGIKRLIDEFNMTHQVAAEAVGRSRSAVTNLLRLLTLHVKVQEMLMQNSIDMGHARALIALNGAKQITAAEQIAQKGLSVREAEQLVKRINSPPRKSAAKSIDADVARLQEEVSETLGATVKIQPGKNGAGVVKIHYASLSQLDEILAGLKKTSRRRT
ncbi:MAG: chromosome partitioning protein ParB [Methylophilales bacterium RIFCSPHIGHO2_02_FULL_57_10]|nr:MAG: chromosome partitioning protein ParB [Methylophilales bacterium RIFCSPHIGHO2_02_FULL_57_10]